MCACVFAILHVHLILLLQWPVFGYSTCVMPYGRLEETEEESDNSLFKVLCF